MLAAGLKTPTPLNELESHLREDMRAIPARLRPELEALAFQLLSPVVGQPPALCAFRSLNTNCRIRACWPARMALLASMQAR